MLDRVRLVPECRSGVRSGVIGDLDRSPDVRGVKATPASVPGVTPPEGGGPGTQSGAGSRGPYFPHKLFFV